MTPVVIEARIRRLEARKPILNHWKEKESNELQKYKELAIRNTKIIDDEIQELKEMLNDSQNRNTQGEITKED